MSREAEALPDSDRVGEAHAPRETLAFFGHAAAERDLLDAYKANKMPQAILIGGAQGVGKATLAWRLARFVLANPNPDSEFVRSAAALAVAANNPVAHRIAHFSHGDVSVLRREWNAPAKKHYSEIRIDDVRKITDRFKLASGESGWRIAVVDSAEDLNRNGGNALLKLIEEPPPQCLFLIIAHRPGQVLPTLRSRCRKIMLETLAVSEVMSALQACGQKASHEAMQQAAERSGGSVREALRLLEGSSLALDAKLDRMFRDLPKLDGREVYTIADQCARVGQGVAFETFAQAVFQHLDASVNRLAAQGHSARALAPLAKAYDEARAAFRAAETFNLDKRSLIVSLFNILAQASRQNAG